MYGRGRKLDKAVEIFNAARNLGVSLDEKAYMNLINYYGKAGIILLNSIGEISSHSQKYCSSFMLQNLLNFQNLFL